MGVPSDSRHFSEVQHAKKRWNTASLKTRSSLVAFFVNLLSFKHSELHRFTKECETGDLLLELGSGNGSRAADMLHRTDVQLMALDWSYTALLDAKNKDGRVNGVCADAAFLPFKQRVFDGMFSVDMLGHVRNVEQVLDELNRVLRPGARMFIHSECSDYRNRWPDRMLIKKTGADFIAALDGHSGIMSASELRKRYDKKFRVDTFYAPAGITGWLTGYPEKYAGAFRVARCPVLFMLTKMAAAVKKMPVTGLLLRTFNLLLNHGELLLGIAAGGSCFARMRKHPEHVEPYVACAIDCVIATLSRPEEAAALVNKLACQCTGDDRVIVVWQGNIKPDIPATRGVRLIHQKRKNLPDARNRGVHAGGNHVVLFLDDDCEIADNLLIEHRKMYAEKQVGAVAGFIDDPIFGQDDIPFSTFNPETGEIGQRFNVERTGGSVTLMGAHMSMRRSVLDAVGGVDPHYTGNAIWEDVDLAFRIQNKGYTIAFCSSAKVKHLRSGTGGCRNAGDIRYTFQYLANTFYFMCTYAEIRYIKKWLRYWWYRLEFMSRKNNIDGNVSHYMGVVVAGLTGMIVGVFRYVIAGRRQGMPDRIISQHQKLTGEKKC